MSGNNNWTGTNTFNINLPTTTLPVIDYATQLASASYVNDFFFFFYPTMVQLTGNNIWSNESANPYPTAFTDFVYTDDIPYAPAYELISFSTKAYVNQENVPSNIATLSGNNVYTAANYYLSISVANPYTDLPTLTASLTSKYYVDRVIPTVKTNLKNLVGLYQNAGTIQTSNVYYVSGPEPIRNQWYPYLPISKSFNWLCYILDFEIIFNEPPCTEFPYDNYGLFISLENVIYPECAENSWGCTIGVDSIVLQKFRTSAIVRFFFFGQTFNSISASGVGPTVPFTWAACNLNT